MSKTIKKTHFNGTETLFERKGATVKDLTTGKSETHLSKPGTYMTGKIPSINAAKLFCRKQVDATGLNSVVVIR